MYLQLKKLTVIDGLVVLKPFWFFRRCFIWQGHGLTSECDIGVYRFYLRPEIFNKLWRPWRK